MKRFKGIPLTEGFRNLISDVVEEVGYEYMVTVSATNKDFYGNGNDDEIIKNHLEHISSDYLEDDGYETVLSNGYIKGFGVYGEFLFRRKK